MNIYKILLFFKKYINLCLIIKKKKWKNNILLQIYGYI